MSKSETGNPRGLNKKKLKRRELRQYQPEAGRLRTWLRLFLGVRIPHQGVCPHHVAPFEYIRRSYFEPGRDVVVWAPRGGGKTRLGALATLLDLLHKPAVQVRILGGSLEQSLKMWEHLRRDLERLVPQELKRGLLMGRRVELLDGSQAAVLAQSERAVRGVRVQKLRCDEVELFEPEIWEAAQFVTRSAGEAKDGTPVQATIEAMSTYHRPWGMMKRVVEHAASKQIDLLHWCILDVLEKCPPERTCTGCALWDDCRGVAKTRCDGFFRIDDAIQIKRRSSAEHWESEMLCRRPSTRGRVFKSFDRARHVVEEDVDASRWKELAWGVDFGYRDPFVCLWVIATREGEFHVVDEYVRRERVMHEHLAELEGRRWGRPGWVGCDPAGNGKNDQTADSNVDLLKQRGYRVRSGGSKIVDGVEMIRFAMQPASGEPTLFVHARCVQLIEALECYHYKEDGAGGENPEKDGVHDHLVDALRYFFINRRRGVVMVRERY